MRWIMVIAFAFLLTTPTWAGTFRDNFEDRNLSGWELDKYGWEAVEFQVEKGEASIQTNSLLKAPDGGRQSRTGTMMTGSGDWRNYTLELRVKIVERDYDVGGEVIIGILTDELPPEIPQIITPLGRQPWGVLMEITPDRNGEIMVGVITVFKIDPPIPILGGEWKPERVFTEGKWAIPLRTWHHVKMIAQNGQFNLFFNNDRVIRFDAPRIMSGKVRLSAIGVHAHFDDVVITGENIPDIGPSGLSVSAKGKLAMTWGSIKQEK